MEELKPCPFCGERHVMHEQGHVIVTETARSGPRYGVSCYSCGGRIEFFDTVAEAIDAWNTRAERTCRNANTDGYGFRFECCECGYTTIVHNCAIRLDELPNYCPSCGAKVVEG